MDKELKKVLKAAFKRGWRRISDGKHARIEHVASGRKVQVSLSPSDRNAHHSLRRAIERAEKEVA